VLPIQTGQAARQKERFVAGLRRNAERTQRSCRLWGVRPAQRVPQVMGRQHDDLVIILGRD